MEERKEGIVKLEKGWDGEERLGGRVRKGGWEGGRGS